MTRKALLRFEQVGCRRGGAMLFSDISFVLDAGGALLLHGSNGAGKSSLIRLAAGLLRPEGGTVDRSCAIGLLTHDLALDDGLTVKSAVGFWAKLDGGDTSEADAALQAVGLASLAHVPVRFLSSGQKRRAALARVIASAAPLWLLDEPGVGLDSRSLDLLTSAIGRHRSSGGAVVVATHMDLGLGDARRIDLGVAC